MSLKTPVNRAYSSILRDIVKYRPSIETDLIETIIQLSAETSRQAFRLPEILKRMPIYDGDEVTEALMSLLSEKITGSENGAFYLSDSYLKKRKGIKA